MNALTKPPYQMSDAEVQQRRDRAVLQTIWINEIIVVHSRRHGNVRIQADTFGPFAVHYAMLISGQSLDRFTLTHLPTGLKIATFAREERAKTTATRLLDMADWWFTNEAHAAAVAMYSLEDDIAAVVGIAGGVR